MKKLLLTASVLSLMTVVAFARDGRPSQTYRAERAASTRADERIGLGFNSQLSGRTRIEVNGNTYAAPQITSLALRYWADSKIGFEGILGFGFGDDTKIFDLGGKFLYTIKKEANMRVYGVGLLGIENASIKIAGSDHSETAFTIAGGLGTEFFLNGLPNLGFGIEMGVGYNSSSKTFGTEASWLNNVGVRYYFE